MEPLSIALCEDDPAEREALRALLPGEQVSVFASGEAFLAAYRPGAFDLILMDIYLEGLDGVEAVRRVRERERTVPIAFATVSRDHALEGYRLDVDKYLEKPVGREELEPLLALARRRREERESLSLGRGTALPLSRLRYAEQKGHYLTCYLDGGEVLQRKGKLDELASRLAEPPFLRCHKSFLVNLDYVTGLDREQLVFRMREGGCAYIRREDFYRARSAWENRLFSAARRKGEPDESEA